MLSGSKIQLSLNGREVLAGVDITLAPATVTAILGPNGAGKTTLLKVLAGEWQAHAGEVRLDGRLLRDIPVKDLGKRRAFLHQESHLDFAFTVMEVVLLGRAPHMQSGERMVDRHIARSAIADVDLSGQENNLYTRLSGGEKQRVQLARILAQIRHAETPPARYLFLDEPTNNLDPAHQHTVFRICRDLAKEGVAICLILHDLNEALRIANHIIVMAAGKIALAGPPAKIAHDRALDDIFGVAIQRLALPDSDLPYLVFRH